MAEQVEVVIKIPVETYEYWKNHSHEYVLAEAIKNGTPLPKGHRFIDADEILNHAFITEDEEGDTFAQKYYCIEKEIMDNALVLFDTLEAESEDK